MIASALAPILTQYQWRLSLYAIVGIAVVGFTVLYDWMFRTLDDGLGYATEVKPVRRTHG